MTQKLLLVLPLGLLLALASCGTSPATTSTPAIGHPPQTLAGHPPANVGYCNKPFTLTLTDSPPQHDWQYTVQIRDTDPKGMPWASVASPTGTLPKGGSVTVSLTPNAQLCQDLGNQNSLTVQAFVVYTSSAFPGESVQASADFTVYPMPGK
jgi:hypothetical protein